MNLAVFRVFLEALKATRSPDDAEALQAIRRANQLLAIENKSWENLLASKLEVSIQVTDAPPRLLHSGPEVKASNEEIEYWLEELLTGRLSPGFREVIESIANQFGTGRRLTSEQIRVVKEAYERATNPRSFSGRRDR